MHIFGLLYIYFIYNKIQAWEITTLVCRGRNKKGMEKEKIGFSKFKGSYDEGWDGV
jgi:hypothetical protein